MTAPHADDVRVYCVFDTDQSGAYLYGIYATMELANEARRTFQNSSWVDDRWVVEGLRNDGQTGADDGSA